ncbi:substrate-binding periplasmic protein [Roseateles violae]|uniref:Transporter substrate-binding domain-containing protein n=1 Tax=Roseateles violae TaxID=3058042 RepID=A0ABT8DRF9_9BURK|nr:transporter substrate-binding domain-containing protein [Pelomonas sp. PFR6]MDN3919519.1 transporter substrate-binding domain-containing protein [Pelomonas sp. PFR6]
MLDRRKLLAALGLLSGPWAVAAPAVGAAASAGGGAGAPGGEPLTVLLEPVPPFSYQDADGKPAGYAVELAQEMLRRCHLKANIEFNSWTRIYQRAIKDARVLVVSMARLDEREPHFFWIGPTAARRAYLYRLKSRPEVRASSLEAAKAYRIAVIRDDAAERDLLARGFELGTHLDRSPDHAAMLRKLFAERDDLAALNSTVAAATLAQFGYDFNQIEPLVKISETRLFMALSRGSGEALHANLLRAWEAMKRDGTVAATAARHPHVNLPD